MMTESQGQAGFNYPRMLLSLLFWFAASVGGWLLVKAAPQHPLLFAHSMGAILGVIVGGVAWLCTLLWRNGRISAATVLSGIFVATLAVINRHIVIAIVAGGPVAVVIAAVVTYAYVFTTVRRYERLVAGSR